MLKRQTVFCFDADNFAKQKTVTRVRIIEIFGGCSHGVYSS